MASTNLPKWLQVIEALTAQPDKIVWQAPCFDCQESHTNFALRDWETNPTHPVIAWHNCGVLDTCCGCHVAETKKDCSYFGSELHDSETAENLAYAWYARKEA